MAERVTKLGFCRDLFKKQFYLLEEDLNLALLLCKFQKDNLLAAFLKNSNKKVNHCRAKLSKFYFQNLSYVNSVNDKNLKALNKWRKQQKQKLKYYRHSRTCARHRQKKFKYWTDKDITALIELEERMYKRQLQNHLKLSQNYRNHYQFLKSYEGKLFSLGIFPL